MMRHSIRLLPLLIAAALGTARAATLESATLRVGWDDARGAMDALVDKGTGRNWLPAVRPASSPYAVLIAGAQQEIDLAQAARVRVSQESPEAVTLEATHETPVPLIVTCRFALEKGAGSPLLARVSLRAPASVRLAHVRFPVITLRAPFTDGGGPDERVLLPECDGIVIHDPAVNLGMREAFYPGKASLQLLAAYDARAGVSLAARDGSAHAKMFRAHRVGSALDLSVVHLPPQNPIERWEPGYDVALDGLVPAEGMRVLTWESAADLYRRWAVTQAWCRRTMTERVASGDIPSWITRPSLIVTFSLRGLRPDDTFGDRLPFVVDQANGWRAAVGAPVTFLIMSWEKLDSWTTPDYFPPFGGEARFVEMTRRLHADGHRTMVYLSGLHWTLRKEMSAPGRPRVSVDQQAEFDRRGRPWAISDEHGQAMIVGEPGAGVGRHATICPATPLARELLPDAARRCQALGIDCVQVDQIVGGGMKPCYHPGHEHPPGGGTWCADALRGLFGGIRAEGKRRDADFAFAIEEPGEFYIPLLDTYHARDLHQGRWPRSGKGIEGVPLFTHVYHDYVAGYGSEGVYASERPSRTTLYQIAMNLVCGKAPAVALWGRWCDPARLDPVQRRLLRAHIDLWRGPAGDFLNFGRRIAAPALDVPMLDMRFTEKDGKTRRTLPLPSVLHAAWQLADGRAGTLFASIAEQPVEFTHGNTRLRLEPGEAVFRPGPNGSGR